MSRRAYHQHRGNAKLRGVSFLLSFEEWYDVWISSGYWDQRGPASDQYCMARFGDVGAYEVGNVKIITNRENRGERNARWAARFGADNPAFGKDYWAGASPEERARRAAAVSKAHKGRPKSAQTRAAMSKAALGKPKPALSITATGRKWVTRNGKRTWAYPKDLDYPKPRD